MPLNPSDSEMLFAWWIATTMEMFIIIHTRGTKWSRKESGVRCSQGYFSGLQRNGCRNPIDQSPAALNLENNRDDDHMTRSWRNAQLHSIPFPSITSSYEKKAEMMTKWKKLWISVDQCVMNWFTFPFHFSSAYSLNDVVSMICSICDWITSDLSLPRSLSIAFSLSLWRCFICFHLYSFTSVAWVHMSTHHLRRHTCHVVSLGVEKLHRRALWMEQSIWTILISSKFSLLHNLLCFNGFESRTRVHQGNS